jgi:hypothetical protein
VAYINPFPAGFGFVTKASKLTAESLLDETFYMRKYFRK